MSGDDIRGSLPHSVEAEQSVLGALLLDNDAIDRCGDIRADDFFVADPRAIFAELLRAREVGKWVAAVMLCD